MNITVRSATANDCAGILACHVAAIRQLCSGDYSDTQLLAWSSRLTVDGYLPAIQSNLFLVAEHDSQVVGFAEFALSLGEVVAVYVHPQYARRGVGTMLFHAVERHAREAGVHELHLSSSLTAVPFYERFGFVAAQQASHRLGDGTEIPCVPMRRTSR